MYLVKIPADAFHYSFDDKTKAQKFIQTEMHEFNLEMCEMYKTADFQSNLLVPWELVTEGYQGRPVKCTKQLISIQIC